MKAKILFIAMLALMDASAGRAAGDRLKVMVDCVGDDPVGSRFCFALKERIRASQSFLLVNSAATGVIEIHVGSLDDEADKGGNSCAAAIVFTIHTKDGLELFLDSLVADFGGARVHEEAEQVLAEVDKQTAFLRSN